MRVCGKFESRYCLTALLFFGLLPAAYSAQLRSGTNIHIAKYEPALAIRASGCITCHAKVRGAFITDFGHGDRYFFGNHGADSSLGPFTGSIYGDFYGGEPNKTGWLTAEITNSIIVPQAGINFNLAAAGNKLAKSNYEKALQAASLAKYLQSLESQKSKPAAILERKKVFIGAPGAATLEARFHIAHASGIQSKYIKSSSDSPNLSGIELASGKEYYTNVRDIVCDGDLFIRGSLFLNGASIATKTGCRIYATGPVFFAEQNYV